MTIKECFLPILLGTLGGALTGHTSRDKVRVRVRVRVTFRVRVRIKVWVWVRLRDWVSGRSGVRVR